MLHCVTPLNSQSNTCLNEKIWNDGGMLLRTDTLTEKGLCDGLTAFAEYRLNLTPTIVMFMF